MSEEDADAVMEGMRRAKEARERILKVAGLETHLNKKVIEGWIERGIPKEKWWADLQPLYDEIEIAKKKIAAA